MNLRKKYMASVSVISLLFFLFIFFASDQLQIKQLGMEIGIPDAYGGEIYAGTTTPTPPLPTDLSDPGILKYSWGRLAGREDAIYLNIPSNQLSKRIQLPSSPSPMIMAKYDPTSRVGTLALMRMVQAGPLIKAEIVQLTPSNFHHSMGKHFYKFAWLDFNYSTPGCDVAQKQLSMNNSPQFVGITNGQIIHDLGEYDRGASSIPPTFIFTPSEQAAINASSYYWHQRLNNDPCFNPIAFSGYDAGDGDWHNISQTGFYNLVAFAQQIHKAGASFIAFPNIRTDVKKETHSSFFTKTTKTTVSYWLKPDWTVGTRANRGSYSEILANPTWVPSNDVSFVSVKGNHTFPVTETLIHQWSQTQSGLTGLFVFIAIIVMVVLCAVGIGEMMFGAMTALGDLVGVSATVASIGVTAVGAVAGLMASGFSPSTNTTADITPFYDSSYDLSQPNLGGDQLHVQQNTDSMWLNTPVDSTPGGVSQFITAIDFRKALACGGASHTAACSTSAIEQIGMDDPRFKSTFNEMFIQPTKDLQQYKYPFIQR